MYFAYKLNKQGDNMHSISEDFMQSYIYIQMPVNVIYILTNKEEKPYDPFYRGRNGI